MEIGIIKPYLKNVEVFDDLIGNDFNDLKQSIKDHGIIEPVIISQYNVIIAGHQRYRACLELGITDVPVVVREVEDDAEHETLLIEDNIRGRQLSVSQTARAIKRLYEIRGINGTGPKQDGATVALIAQETGKSERTIKTLRTIADLIPELSQMLDAQQITQKVAYQLAQMDAEGQSLVFGQLQEHLKAMNMTEQEAKDLKDDYKEQKKTIATLNASIKELKGKLPTSDVLKKIEHHEKELKDAKNFERLKFQEQVKALKTTYQKAMKAKEKKLVDDIIHEQESKLKHIKKLDAEIQELSVKRDSLDSQVGAAVAYKTASKKIRHNLYDISITLNDVFNEYPIIPEECVTDLQYLCSEMEKGTESFNQFINPKKVLGV